MSQVVSNSDHLWKQRTISLKEEKQIDSQSFCTKWVNKPDSFARTAEKVLGVAVLLPLLFFWSLIVGALVFSMGFVSLLFRALVTIYPKKQKP